MNDCDFYKNLKKIHDKWYFDIPIFGKMLKLKTQYNRMESTIKILNDHITTENKKEWNSKSRDEQYKLMENTIKYIVEDVSIYTKPNWKKICEEIRQDKMKNNII